MDKGLGLLSSETIAIPIKADPRLKLLFELPPRYEVFLDNLADLLSPPKVPPLETTTPPGTFWTDVFVRGRMPWRSMQESIIWHLVSSLLLWSLSGQEWVLHREPHVRQHSARESHITYYPPSQTYSARASSHPKTRVRTHPQPVAAHPRPLQVAHQASRAARLVVPPDLKSATASRPNLGPSSPALPPVPLSATERGRSPLAGGLTSVVAPPPTVSPSGNRPGGGLPTSVVGPPPDASGISARRAAAPPASASVVAPPPTLQGWMRKIESLFGDSWSGAGSQVVPPPPSVPETGGTGVASWSGGGGSQVIPPPPSVAGTGVGGRGSLGAAGTQVVPPPPSVQGMGGGRTKSLSAAGAGVVPPPPSIPATGDKEGRSGLHSLSANGAPIIPPPPSMRGAGGSGGPGSSLSGPGTRVVPPPPSLQGTGSSGAGGRTSALSGPGPSVVPPPPSVSGTGGSGGGRIGSLSGNGTGVVPPPPSVQGGGGTASRVGSLSGTGTAVVPPPPSVSGSGGNGEGRQMASLAGGEPAVGAPPAGPPGGGGPGPTGPLQQMDDDIPPGADLPPTADSPPPGPAEEFPLRLVSLALPTQGSSFFSNYEVFIAERRLPKGHAQLIKLVYVFLPYQKRLSEYIQSNARVYTLRVTRDTSCDESLMQMTWSDSEQDFGDSNPFPGADRNSRLPCYRTTAEDYQKALVRGQ